METLRSSKPIGQIAKPYGVHPITIHNLNKWLAGFAYRMRFSVWFLLIPSAFTLGLAALTVSYHTIKAATANPVDSLRYE